MTTSIRTECASRAAARLAGGFIALALGACATMGEQECRSADWEALGRAEGARGAPAGQVESQRKACAKHGVTLQEVPWRVGYAKGIEEFCTPRGGYLAGRSASKAKPELCAGKPQEEAFKSALREGKEIATLMQEVRSLRSALQQYETETLSDTRNSDEMAQLYQRIAAIREAIGAREWEIDRRDGEYAAAYGVPPLGADGQR